MKLIEKIWYHKHILRWALWPFSWLFRFITFLRRQFFKLGLYRLYISQVPVIIVGNIHVGGVGKTPLVLKLVEHFQSQGITVGVVSRGYGANKNNHYPYEVTLESSALEAGDEPLMIKQLTGVPVVIAPKRAQAVDYLTSHYRLDVILSDDGLQHYALARSIEIAVMDAERLGNGYCLPAGPLREDWLRLNDVDFVVVNNLSRALTVLDKSQGIKKLEQLTVPVFSSVLGARYWVNVHTEERVAVDRFKGQRVNVVAGIGHPQRFFNTCMELGGVINHSCAFSDHHNYQGSDFENFNQELPLLMTEKDAVKCKQWLSDNAWALHVELEFQCIATKSSELTFFDQLINKLKVAHNK
ncbi:tetraacyldisaccharide 4'-kinase [Piscirickettsia salmonis]|uniref:tetraacyldisaccharide 4'-kinase n=1 Tax=Piscirickettsia salmonis TaxID=1238 RepID=UPI0007C9213B|nr:Tetraacyldisaccharide 4'-kinase [Piscirickettsiaceae bacterium NZ-RLO1]